MHHNGTKTLFDYWNRQRRDRPAPMHADIAPDAIAHHLPDLFIVDMDQAPPVLRLAGTRICELYGKELTGSAFSRLFDQADHKMARQLLAAVSGEHTIGVVDLQARNGRGETVGLEMLILPLADVPPRVIGVLNAIDAPYWLGTDAVRPAAMTGVRIMDPDRHLFSLTNRPAINLPKRPVRTFGRRPHNWQIIDGGDAAAAGESARATGPDLKVVGEDKPGADNGR